jgi:hypothetical protein
MESLRVVIFLPLVVVVVVQLVSMVGFRRWDSGNEEGETNPEQPQNSRLIGKSIVMLSQDSRLKDQIDIRV